LAQGMENSTIVPVPSDYQLSEKAKELLSMLEPIDFELKYAFLRDALLAGY
jgi:hypothetical protein